MKTVFNIVLVLCAAALIYICYTSIMGPINFENAKKEREKAVIARLIDIRKAQQEYRSLHRGMYAPKLDTLIDFVKNQKLPFVMKMGMLTDKQLEDGLTEKKAMAIIEKAKKTGRYDEVKKWGLENFKRDTMWVAVLDTIYPKGFNADSMKYIPHGNGAQFEMNVKNDTAKSGAPVYLFEVKAPYETYLSGLDKQEIINLKDLDSKLGKYSGLMVGSIDTPNNGAQFEMNVRNDTAKSGAPVYLFEVKAPYDTYLSGLDKQEIINLKDLDSKLGKYSGLMVGSIDTPNNGAGNWE